MEKTIVRIKSNSEIDDNKILMESKLDKQNKLDELKLKVKQLREERIARHAARVESLKKKNLEKYSNQTPSIQNFKKNGSGDLSKAIKGPKHSISTKSSVEKLIKTSIPPPVVKVSKSTSTTLFAPSGEPSDPPKTSVLLSKKNKYDNVEKKVDCRLSFIPKANVSSPKIFPSQNKSAVQQKKVVNGNISLNLKIKSSISSVNKEIVKSKELTSKNDSNVTKKIDLSAIQRLARPKYTSALTAAPHHDKDKKIPEKSLALEPLQNKRWTMASVDRLSRPKTASKVTVALKPVNNVQNRKNVPSQIRDKSIPVPRRVTEIHKPNDESKIVLKQNAQLRRSLSTVHFKRMGPDAAKKCLKRTLSVGNMKRRNLEDEVSANFPPKDYILPVASERKKSVKFMTPNRKTATPNMFLNTPKPSELRQRLNDWLQKRGKSLSNYHHLHCFGIHNGDVATKEITPTDDENKENEEISDDDSFSENMTGRVKDVAAEWRSASYQYVDSPAVSQKTPETSPDLKQLTLKKESDALNPTMTGALNDLNRLIVEGYSWQQCAEWLRAIVNLCGVALTETAPYWECRAALEERRGDFPRAVECYNKAIMQGAQPVEVEASLDQLLQKFMKLNLDPEKQSTHILDPKFLDVKNVFKSTLIRFAIQQKNIVESKGNNGNLKTKYVATPVRRSSRLSKVPDVLSASKPHQMSANKTTSDIKKPGFSNPTQNPPFANGRTSGMTPLKAATPLNKSARKSTGRPQLVQLCSTLHNVDNEIRSSMVFVPNKALNFNDC